MTRNEANQLTFTLPVAQLVEELVKEKIQLYILEYSSTMPLSKEWVAKKGHSNFWIGLGNHGEHAYDIFRIRYEVEPLRWDVFNVYCPQWFRYATYMETPNGVRAFLPSGFPSFTPGGEPTPELCMWIEDLILDSLTDMEGLLI